MNDVLDLQRLQRLHETIDVIGPEAISRRFGPRRSIYRWLRRIRSLATYRARISYAALDLAQVHLFIRHADSTWFNYPYAIDRAWVFAQPGEPVLYLRCLVPREHVDKVPSGGDITSITSDDGWQQLSPLDQALYPDGRPRQRSAIATARHHALVAHCILGDPLIVPVACELATMHPTMTGLWRTITDRLGPRLHEFLPRKRRNGNAHLRRTFLFLNQYGLVLQHHIQYRPLEAHTIEVLFLTDDSPTLRDALVSICPTVETYATSDGYLARASGDIALIKCLLAVEGVRHWWFVDHQRTNDAPRVRFAYEVLFDARPKTWRRP